MIVKKLYWTISEVAQKLGKQTQDIREWEKKYGALHSKRTRGNRRAYSRRDLAYLLIIQRIRKDNKCRLDTAMKIHKRWQDLN